MNIRKGNDTFASNLNELATEVNKRQELNERESYVYNSIRETIMKRALRGYTSLTYNLFTEKHLSEKSVSLIIKKLESDGFKVEERGLMDGLRIPPMLFISWKNESIEEEIDNEESQVIDISDLNF